MTLGIRSPHPTSFKFTAIVSNAYRCVLSLVQGRRDSEAGDSGSSVPGSLLGLDLSVICSDSVS